MYKKLVYCGKTHCCIASLCPEIKEHSIVINGFSKAYAMTGWRIGYSAAPPPSARRILHLQHTTFVQWAALEALEGEDGSVERMVEEFSKRREYVYGRLSAMDGIVCPPSEGAFYFFPRMEAYYGKTWKGEQSRTPPTWTSSCWSRPTWWWSSGAAFEGDGCVRVA